MKLGQGKQHGTRAGAGIAGALRTILLGVLDTKYRPWLSPRLWLPLLIAINILVVVVFPGVRRSFGVGGGLGRTVFWDGSRASLEQPPGVDGMPDWDVYVALNYSGSDRQLWASAELTVTPLWETAAAPTPEQMAQIKKLAIGLISEYAEAMQNDLFESSPGAQEWLAQTWAQQVRDGTTQLTARPIGLVSRASLMVAPVVQALSLLLFVAVVVRWFVCGAQVAAYSRMLRRHETGRCPRCDYDISAAPDQVCPECGCDHRAIRQEAIEALRRAGRWPLEGPVPSGRH